LQIFDRERTKRNGPHRKTRPNQNSEGKVFEKYLVVSVDRTHQPVVCVKKTEQMIKREE